MIADDDIHLMQSAAGDQEALVSVRSIIEQTVAGVFDIDVRLMRSSTRGRAQIALARQVAMYLAHVGCGFNLTEVGTMFERDRTTVSHACSVVELRRDEARFDQAIELLELVIKVFVGSTQGSTTHVS